MINFLICNSKKIIFVNRHVYFDVNYCQLIVRRRIGERILIYQGGLLPDHEDAILTDTASPTGDDNDDDNDNYKDDVNDNDNDNYKDDVNDNNNDDDNDNDTAHFTDLVTACDQDSLRDNRGENIQENW